ncbi:MAG: AtpZ/AtpI family protein [Chloroflexota bacterium]|jgi:F0F1-type ATP synthase assembly protein I
MKRLTTWQALIVASQLGFVLAASVGIGLYAGWYLDSVLNTSPVFAIIGALAGMVAGILSCVQIVRASTGNGPSE